MRFRYRRGSINRIRVVKVQVSCVYFFYLVCETIGTAATPGPIVPASGDSEDDCGEQMECRLAGETEAAYSIVLQPTTLPRAPH
jgi:hypothetical protein